MGATRNLGYIENLISYDGNDNIGIGGAVNVLYKVTINGNTLASGTLNIGAVTNAGVDTDKFLVLDTNGTVRFRTGAELASDIGTANLAASTLKHVVKLGEAVSKGQAVYVSSADGTNMIVSKASNASEATSSKTLGLVETTGILNDQVNVITEGLLAGLDTSTAVIGDPVWLGTNGNIIFGLNNKPYAPAHLVFIGVVTRVQQNNGEIFVKVQNGFEIQELHNVQITSTPADNSVLSYENSSSLYKMKSIPTLLGYTPVTDARTITINGTSYDLTANRTWSVGTVTSVSALTIGTTGTDITSTVATGTTTPVITLNIPTASATNRGALSSSDWSTFNGKQDALNGTGFVKISGTTISYDNSTYLTSYTETDTLATVTGRGASTTNTISISASSLQHLILANRFHFIGGTNFHITNNAYYDGSFKYKDSVSPASKIVLNGNGTISYDYAPAGTIDTVIPFTTVWSIGTNGSITANSFIKSGGTSSQILMADGSVLTAGTNITISGGTISSTGGSSLNGTGFVRMAGTTVSYITGTSSQFVKADGSLDGTGYEPTVTKGNLTSANTAHLTVTGGTGAIIGSGVNLTILPGAIVNSGLGLTTTGSSGAATFSNATLNIPNYTLAGLGGLPLSGGTMTGLLQISNQAAINTTTPGTANYGLHFTGQTTADFATGITWNGGTGTTGAQAGIYVQGSGGYGTKMYIATTDAYVSGSKTAISIDHTGLVNFVRVRPTALGNTIWDSGNLTNLNQLSNGPGYIGVNSASYFGINNTSSTTGHGISLYGSYSGGEMNYGIMFAGTGTFGGYGDVAGADWATYFMMNNSNTRGWIFRKYGTANVASISGAGNATFAGYVYAGGNLTVNGAGTSSNIYMNDTDEGQRVIHCNSNRIGFLRQDGSWGSYCNDDGSWTSDYNISGADVYTTGGWFRNHTNNNGIYWSGTAWHLYPKNTSDFYLRSGASDASILFMRNGTEANYIHNASDNAIGFLSTGRSWIFRVDNSGNATAYGSLTSNGLIRVNGNTNLYLDYNYGCSIVGVYTSTRYQGVFAMGDAYKLPIDGTSTGNLYGMCWSHPNAGGVAGNLNTHGLLVLENGTFLAAISGSIRARDNMMAPIYYDRNDTAKYLTRNTSSYGSWYMGGSNNGYSGWRVDGGMNLMIHTNGVSAPCGFFHESLGWSILTYTNGSQYLYHNTSERFRTDSGGVVITGTLYATGDVIAFYSDIRLKKDIVEIDSAVDKIKKLRGVTYTWNDNEVNIVKERAGTRDIGLIAQEVEAIEPLLITEYETQLNTPGNNPEEAANFKARMSEKYKTIKYDKLVALLVEGMKEQQKQIEELKLQIKNK